MKVGSDIRIVHCNPLDHKHFSKLSEAYPKLFNQDDNLKLLSLSNQPFDSHTISTFLKNSPQDSVEYYAALAENEIIGISILEKDILSGLKIIGIVVEEKYRQKGIGRSLILMGIETATKNSYKAVDVSVFADNKPMIILLIKMGFKIIKIEYHARYDGEDLIHLKKYL